MKAAIRSPYLDTLGGGERYVLTVANILSSEGWTVDVETEDEEILNKAQEKFNLDLSNVNIKKSIRRGDGYDLCFWLSDGSVPTLFSRKNILHFQRPFSDVEGSTLLNKMKFIRINSVVVNSRFTAAFIDKEYPKKSTVIYPPVDVDKFKPSKKENLILYVGRYSQLEQSKGQNILIRNFKKFHDKYDKSWKLVLAGGSEVGRTSYVDRLKKSAKNYPIQIIENAPFSDLKKYFGKARFFWSASGFGVNEEKTPQRVEHFGITVVEALAAGCIPIIFEAGGHKEIIRENENGFLWKSGQKLVNTTARLADDKKLLSRISKQAVTDSKPYGLSRFKKQLLQVILGSND